MFLKNLCQSKGTSIQHNFSPRRKLTHKYLQVLSVATILTLASTTAAAVRLEVTRHEDRAPLQRGRPFLSGLPIFKSSSVLIPETLIFADCSRISAIRPGQADAPRGKRTTKIPWHIRSSGNCEKSRSCVRFQRKLLQLRPNFPGSISNRQIC